MQDLYFRQLAFVFDRPVGKPEWYFMEPSEEVEEGEERVFDDDPITAFAFIERLLQNPEVDMKAYSDDQVGLGHLVLHLPDIAVPIIDGYLKKGKKKDEGLKDYAQMARTGMIL